MTTSAKGPRWPINRDLPAVHPDQAPALQRAVAKHRRKPNRPSTYNLLVAAILVTLSVTALEGWAAIMVAALGVVNAVTFLVMHFRHAAWVVTTGAAKELDR